MSDQFSNKTTIDGKAISLPDPVLQWLSIEGIDPARFLDLVQAFGRLPDEGQVQLANGVNEARSQYVNHRISLAHDTTRPSNQRDRLRDIGSAAERLLRLLHRDGADPAPWTTHHAVTGALPQLCRISSQCRQDAIWDPPQGLSLLSAMLADLTALGTQAEAIYPVANRQKRGGNRRLNADPRSELVRRLIELYEALRKQYPETGPAPAFSAPLIQFVRAGLTFAISRRKFPDGMDLQSSEAAFIDRALPKLITDDAIRGVYQRLHKARGKSL